MQGDPSAEYESAKTFASKAIDLGYNSKIAT